jgi:hypothetical protein
MRGRWLTSALTFAVLTLPTVCHASVESSVERAAASLFTEFETVAKTDVSRLPFHVLGKPLEDNPERMLFAPFGYLFAAFDFFGPKTAERVAGRTAVILGGFSDFRSPTGFGSISSRNCYVLIVKRGFKLEEFFGRAPTETWGTAPVWRWTAKMGEYGEGDDRPSTLIAVQLDPSYVLVSNDAERILKVAKSLTTVKPKEILARLGEWRDVTTRRYWVYRRYRFDDVVDPRAAAISDVRRDAEALVFFTNATGQPALLRLVSSQPVASQPERIVPKRQPFPGEPPPAADEIRFPHLLPVAPSKWETVVPMSGGHVEWENVYIVMALMGFGAYV